MPDSLQGHLIVAAPKLRDPNFFKTVVLMVQHNDEGALGLVLNRPLEATIEAAWEQVSETPCHAEGPLHQGGPCEGPLMVVHTHETASDIEVFPGVYFTTEREKIEWLMKHNDGAIKFFVGYAGWAAGQLENEIQENGWLHCAADADLIFGGDVEHKYERALRKIGIDPGMLSSEAGHA